MPDVRLKFDGGEIMPKDGVTTLGRTSDNDVAFPSDSNVSRYHAEIEAREGEFCLIDLNSSNGTTVNGVKVTGETYLQPGDRILLGGSSEIIFAAPEEPEEKAADDETEGAGISVSPPPVGDAVRQVPGLASSGVSAGSGSRTMLFIAGGAILIAVVVVGVAGAIYYRSVTSACDAKAKIVKPEQGETLYEATEIEVETENSECVAKAVFTLDGKEFASADGAPYTATVDPKQHPELADGFDHSLGITLIDENGNRIPQPGEVLLAMETREIEAPPERDTPADITDNRTQPGGETKTSEVSAIDAQRMIVQFAQQFPGGRTVPGKQFVLDVQKASAEYAQEGYYARAAPYRDLINVTFVKEYNLPPAFGFVLPMGRTKFNPGKQGADEGLWRLSPVLVASQNFGGDCGGESLSDPKQACASKAAAAYMKELYFTVCSADFMCAVAAFGKPLQDAGSWRASLPKNGFDLWNSAKAGPEREQLVRFFAAGIVTANPGKFGLKRDAPMSQLYP
ncbi:MAG: FHA domain-containing protein [Pyrinomonadaceae bacterium]